MTQNEIVSVHPTAPAAVAAARDSFAPSDLAVEQPFLKFGSISFFVASFIAVSPGSRMSPRFLKFLPAWEGVLECLGRFHTAD